MQVHLQRIVTGIGYIFGLIDGAEAEIREQLVVWGSVGASSNGCQLADRRQIGLNVLALMPVLVSYISDRQHRLLPERLLDTKIELIAHRQFIFRGVETLETGDHDRQSQRIDGCSGLDAGLGIGERNATERGVRTERNV